MAPVNVQIPTRRLLGNTECAMGSVPKGTAAPQLAQKCLLSNLLRSAARVLPQSRDALLQRKRDCVMRVLSGYSSTRNDTEQVLTSKTTSSSDTRPSAITSNLICSHACIRPFFFRRRMPCVTRSSMNSHVVSCATGSVGSEIQPHAQNSLMVLMQSCFTICRLVRFLYG